MIKFVLEGVSLTALFSAILRPTVASIYSPKHCYAHVGNMYPCHHLEIRTPQEMIQ